MIHLNLTLYRVFTTFMYIQENENKSFKFLLSLFFTPSLPYVVFIYFSTSSLPISILPHLLILLLQKFKCYPVILLMILFSITTHDLLPLSRYILFTIWYSLLSFIYLDFTWTVEVYFWSLSSCLCFSPSPFQSESPLQSNAPPFSHIHTCSLTW